MDDVSHAAWGFLAWHGTPYPALAAFMSVFPDILGVLPPYIAAFFHNKGSWSATWNKQNMPSWHHPYKTVMYPWTHSILVSFGVAGAGTLLFGWSASWLFAWPLHVLIDIFTHPRRKAPAFLWPLHSVRVHSFSWWNRTFMIANYAAIIVVGAFVLV
jgi:hypothetical protein